MKTIRLENPMYAILANQKNDLFLGFTHSANVYRDKINDVSQNSLNFAFFFYTLEEAKIFLDKYFMHTSVNPKNKRYYTPICIREIECSDDIDTTDLNGNELFFEIDNNLFVYGVSCYFSISEYCKWRRSPGKYKKF